VLKDEQFAHKLSRIVPAIVPRDITGQTVTSANDSATFITIALSHYCEKARWALDRASVPYREEAHAPLLSRFATRRGAGGTVPVFIQGALRLTDSSAILRHADSLHAGLLYPPDATLRKEVTALEESFDRDLGPHVRRWAYTHLLAQKALLRDLWSRGVPKHEARWLPLVLPIGRKLLRRAYQVTPAGSARSIARIRGMFADVDARLKDGRRFLAGDRFSAADLTFAALAAPLVFAPECRAAMPALEQVPAAMRADVVELRATAAGQFVLRLYATERGITQPAG
jgi:glutathione S-transferase